ncbi:hypothetical protein M1N55_05905 [Dehalococcoidia bacterium]|nr:hypothetical protein [Dehalococcoidia bacterium]
MTRAITTPLGVIYVGYNETRITDLVGTTLESMSVFVGEVGVIQGGLPE